MRTSWVGIRTVGRILFSDLERGIHFVLFAFKMSSCLSVTSTVPISEYSAFSSGTQEVVASLDTGPGGCSWGAGGWGLGAETERQVGGWLVRLGWQCGRWASLLGGWLACVVAGQLAAQPDRVSTWQFWLRLRKACSASHTRSVINIAVETPRLSHQTPLRIMTMCNAVWLQSRSTFTQCYSAAFQKR